MNLKAKISSRQFFSLLLLSRFISVLTYSPIYNAGLNSSDYLIAGVIGMIMVLFSCLPLALIYKSNDNRSVLDMAYEISPIYSKIISVLYILLFLFYAFSTLSRLDLFSGTVIFRESDTKVFVVLSVLLACYSAYLGLEALGRAGAISLFVFSVSFVFIIVTMLSKLDLNNFSPVLRRSGTCDIRRTNHGGENDRACRNGGALSEGQRKQKKRLFYMVVGTCGVFGNCVFLHFFGTRRLCHDPAFPDTFNSRAVRIQRFSAY